MAEQDKEYLSVITSTKIEDVPGWIESYQKRVPKDQERKYTPEKFWTEWKDEKLNNNNTNLEVVWNTYDDIEKVKYKDAYDAKALPFIKPQTTVKIHHHLTPSHASVNEILAFTSCRDGYISYIHPVK